jgi:hypothetical protein
MRLQVAFHGVADEESGAPAIEDFGGCAVIESAVDLAASADGAAFDEGDLGIADTSASSRPC